jgi:hypothetical protein
MKNWRGAGEPGVRADRLRLRPWSDPRLLLGVLLVLGAAVLGARLVAMNDDTIEYWSVAADVRAGDPLGDDQLVPARVRLDDATAERYLRVADELPAAPADLRWGRDLAAGSLLAAADLDSTAARDARELPVLVTEGAMPTDLGRGDQVEIWVGPDVDDGQERPSTKVLGPVRVVRSGSDAESLGGSLARTVLVEVPTAALSGEVVSRIGAGRVTIVRIAS